MSIEAAKRCPRPGIGDSAQDQSTGDGRRDGTVAAHIRRCGGSAQQRFVRQHQDDLRDAGQRPKPRSSSKNT
jgi:hypothetical protein